MSASSATQSQRDLEPSRTRLPSWRSNQSRLPQEAIVAADSALQHPGLYLVKLTPGGLHCGGRVAPLLVRVFQGRQTKSETQRF